MNQLAQLYEQLQNLERLEDKYDNIGDGHAVARVAAEIRTIQQQIDRLEKEETR